ncbi:hypothetical protein JY750_18480 [Clostridioides difficile]|nr:hypothetical protein [Clostridioides difficile]
MAPSTSMDGRDLVRAAGARARRAVAGAAVAGAGRHVDGWFFEENGLFLKGWIEISFAGW